MTIKLLISIGYAICHTREGGYPDSKMTFYDFIKVESSEGRRTGALEFGIGNTECGIEKGKKSDFMYRNLSRSLFSAFRIPTSEFLKPSALYLFYPAPYALCPVPFNNQ
jgi:hypothetical protein